MPSATPSALSGETNIAIMMAICDPSVKDIGSRMIFTGEYIGISTPRAMSMAVMLIICIFRFD